MLEYEARMWVGEGRFWLCMLSFMTVKALSEVQNIAACDTFLASFFMSQTVACQHRKLEEGKDFGSIPFYQHIVF